MTVARSVAADRVRVVELIVADADLDGGEPLPALVAAIDGAERRDDLSGAGIVKRVGREIRGNRLVFQHVHVPLQFGPQNADDGIRPGRLGRRTLDDADERGYEDETECWSDDRIIPQTPPKKGVGRGFP